MSHNRVRVAGWRSCKFVCKQDRVNRPSAFVFFTSFGLVLSKCVVGCGVSYPLCAPQGTLPSTICYFHNARRMREAKQIIVSSVLARLLKEQHYAVERGR